MSFASPSAPPLDSIESMDFRYKDLNQQLHDVEGKWKLLRYHLYAPRVIWNTVVFDTFLFGNVWKLSYWERPAYCYFAITFLVWHCCRTFLPKLSAAGANHTMERNIQPTGLKPGTKIKHKLRSLYNNFDQVWKSFLDLTLQFLWVLSF